MSVPSIENVVQVGAKDVGTEGMSWLDHVVCCQCGVGTVLYSLKILVWVRVIILPRMENIVVY